MSGEFISSQPLLGEDQQDVSASDAPPATGALRQQARKFMSSKYQHYGVLALVTLDLLGIFADIFINLYTCEEGKPSPTWDQVREGLGIAGLVFSCLFMVELTVSLWAFGFKFFHSWFHCLDATIIVAGFVVDVLLRGTLEEIASLIVILRLWRFVKIVEEFSVGAEEQMETLEEELSTLKLENQRYKTELEKRGRVADEEMAVQG